MKLSVVLMLAISLLINTTGYSQDVTLSLKEAPLDSAFALIHRQTSYIFIYTNDQLRNSKPVTINVYKAGLIEVLRTCFRSQPLSYTISDTFIVVHDIDGVSKDMPVKPPLLRGRVTGEYEEPLPGVTIAIAGTNRLTSTNVNGEFSFANVSGEPLLLFSSIGYEPLTAAAKNNNYLNVSLKMAVKELDQAVVIAYGVTTRRLSTGNVARITGEEISQQPVSNPLAVLEGRIPGLQITQSNGLPGGAFKVQLRGQSSIGVTPGFLPANDPLFIIDGVPFAPNNLPINIVGSGTALGTNGRSPFNSIDPNSIESMEVLKDADATAIYGSRGANGVILITTRKVRPGKTHFTGSISTGFGQVDRSVSLLGTPAYLQLRKEALANDGTMPNADNAPDLVLWDTALYTDFKKMLIGGTAHTADAQVSASGGTENTQLLVGAGYHRESTVFPGNLADNRLSFNVKANHSSADKKFTVNFSGIYSSDKNDLITTDLTANVFLAPNTPSLYKSNGQLNWEQNGGYFQNPLAYLKQKYEAETDNLLSNVQLSYSFSKSFVVRNSFGYNRMLSGEISLQPVASLNPFTTTNPTATSYFGSNLFKSWIIEPQMEYTTYISKGKLNILAGSTWQQLINDRSNIQADGYTNDQMIRSMSAAATLLADNNNSEYHYEAVFGRINYNLSNKYLINISGRSDGSSRFGPGRRFGNFGAVGAAWIFSGEDFVKTCLSFLSFGKLRASYGTTGNDQIGDYKYLDTWTSSQYGYSGPRGLYPSQLAVPDYNWEVNRKLEAAVDLGFCHDRILLAAAYFRNRSSNQLIAYTLPSQTGFSSIAAKNFPAVVQNQGLELSLQSGNIITKRFVWKTSFTFTLPHNKLVSFPGLATSSYANLLVEGKSLSVQKRFHYTGVDPATGLFAVQDMDANGMIRFDKDAVIGDNMDTKFYGGLLNTVAFKNWEMGVFFEFRKQSGENYLLQTYKSGMPGVIYYNQVNTVLNRWSKPGDNAFIQRVSATPNAAAKNAIDNFLRSDGVLSDASFIRLKNIYVSYKLPFQLMRRFHDASANLYLKAQNILTITTYPGVDPETKNLYSLPPLRNITVGVQFNF